MKRPAKQLTLEKVDKCEEIRAWMDQFPADDHLVVKSLLCSLQFISRDEFSQWLLGKLQKYEGHQSCAIYSVRKFPKEIQCLWRVDETVQPRPAETQGSEDLVSSVIANANNRGGGIFLDHPSLAVLRNEKVRHILLVDDSIGSGMRVADFIGLMMNHPTFMSWWSYGLVTIHVLSYARTDQAAEYILDHVPGSDHGKRKLRLSEKLLFDSDVVYRATNLSFRWGSSNLAILALCDSISEINKNFRRGFGSVMGNLVFYHSVPNNIPGILYAQNNGWEPLFPGRSVPEWLPLLLESEDLENNNLSERKRCRPPVPDDALQVLKGVKRGLRTKKSLARRLDCDVRLISEILDKCIEAGLITATLHLTKTGCDLIHKESRNDERLEPNYELYVPKSWCAGLGTVQPFALDVLREEEQTDSTGATSVDGDDGESSLERTDDKATSSPNKNGAKHPSGPRDRSILPGPTGLKE